MVEDKKPELGEEKPKETQGEGLKEGTGMIRSAEENYLSWSILDSVEGSSVRKQMAREEVITAAVKMVDANSMDYG